jgi:hypothetical protein
MKTKSIFMALLMLIKTFFHPCLLMNIADKFHFYKFFLFFATKNISDFTIKLFVFNMLEKKSLKKI